MATTDRLFKDAMRLPEKDREKLVVRLAETLEAPDLHSDLDDEALMAEIERRADDIVAGRVKGIPWDEVQRKAFGRRRR